MKKAGLVVSLMLFMLLTLCPFACAAGNCDHNWVTATIGTTYVADIGEGFNRDAAHIINKEMETYCNKCGQVIDMWTEQTRAEHNYSGTVCTL